MGNWTIIDGISEMYGSLMTDLKSIRQYRIATVQQAPFVEFSTDANGKTVFSGYCIDFMKLIQV
jgi:hypothetical protein